MHNSLPNMVAGISEFAQKLIFLLNLVHFMYLAANI